MLIINKKRRAFLAGLLVAFGCGGGDGSSPTAPANLIVNECGSYPPPASSPYVLPYPVGVSVEIFQFNSEFIISISGEHEDVLVSQPELFGGQAEAVLVVVPVSVETLLGAAKVVAPLNHLKLGRNDMFRETRTRNVWQF